MNKGFVLFNLGSNRIKLGIRVLLVLLGRLQSWRFNRQAFKNKEKVEQARVQTWL